MPKKYTNMDQYEEEILWMKKEGKKHRETPESLGLEPGQVKEWHRRYLRKQSKIAAGLTIYPRGKAPKDAKQRDIVAEQEYTIRRLRMENEMVIIF